MKQKKFKKFDRVIIEYTGQEGYIDAIVEDKYLVKCPDGYRWVDSWNLVLKGQTRMVKTTKNPKESKEIKRFLGKDLE